MNSDCSLGSGDDVTKVTIFVTNTTMVAKVTMLLRLLYY